jgi:cytoskeletal protein CcmA (bactofilin family)
MFSKRMHEPSARPDGDDAVVVPVPRRKPRHEPMPSHLSADLRINGDVFSSGPLQIDGQVEGDIHTPSLTLGEQAEVRGRIKADSADINGSVSGEINAGKVLLSRSARVVADVIHESLSVEAGAYIEGSVRRRMPDAPVRPAEVDDAVATPLQDPSEAKAADSLPAAERL